MTRLFECSLLASCILLILLSPSHEISLKVGICPPVLPAVAGIATKLLTNYLSGTAGFTWFEQYHYAIGTEKLTQCLRWTFVETIPGTLLTPSTTSVTIAGIRKVGGRTASASGYFISNGVGLFRPYFAEQVSKRSEIILPRGILVIGIDINLVPDWMVLYGCRTIGPFRIQNVHILTKAKTPTEDVLAQAFQSLDNSGVSTGDLVAVPQINCA